MASGTGFGSTIPKAESATDTSTRLIQEGFPKQIAYKQSGYPKKAAAPGIISGAAAFF
jgi:hypothetical protein